MDCKIYSNSCYWYKYNKGSKKWTMSGHPIVEGMRLPTKATELNEHVTIYEYDLGSYCGIDPSTWILGAEPNGLVFLLPDGKVLKLLDAIAGSEETTDRASNICDHWEFSNGGGAILLKSIDEAVLGSLLSTESHTGINFNSLITRIKNEISSRDLRTTSETGELHDSPQETEAPLFTSTDTSTTTEAEGALYENHDRRPLTRPCQLAMCSIKGWFPTTTNLLYILAVSIDPKGTTEGAPRGIMERVDRCILWKPDDPIWALIKRAAVALISPTNIQAWLVISCLMDETFPLEDVMGLIYLRKSDEEWLSIEGVKKTLERKFRELLAFLNDLISKHGERCDAPWFVNFFVARGTLAKYKERIDIVKSISYDTELYLRVTKGLDAILEGFGSEKTLA